MEQKNNILKIPLSTLYAGRLLIVTSLSTVCMLSKPLFEIASFSFERVCQLPITSVLGMGAYVYFPSQCWNLIWF